MKTKRVKPHLVEREEIFLDIIYELEKHNDEEKRRIALEASVHYTTLYNWTSFKTVAPRISTLVRVARVLGYDIALVRLAAKAPRLRRVK